MIFFLQVYTHTEESGRLYSFGTLLRVVMYTQVRLPGCIYIFFLCNGSSVRAGTGAIAQYYIPEPRIMPSTWQVLNE